MTKLDILLLANSLITNFRAYKINLDYSLESLAEIEAYLTQSTSIGKPKKNTFCTKTLTQEVWPSALIPEKSSEETLIQLNGAI